MTKMTFEEFRARVLEIGDLIAQIPGFDSVVIIIYNDDLGKVIVGGHTQTEQAGRELVRAALLHMGHTTN